MTTSFLIMLREGFEAALIVAVVFAYLRKLDRLELSSAVWGGVAAAAAISVAVGVIVHLTIGDLTGSNRLLAFAVVSFLALCVLTWMVFWMKRQAAMVKGDLERSVDAALHARHIGFALALVAFLAVLREGIEAALFLIAAATEEDGTQVMVGAFIGLAVAGAIAYSVYFGGRKLSISAFFRLTGVVLIVFAAGLASRTVLYLQSAGDLGSFNLNGVYDVRSIQWLTNSSEVGKFLSAMVGWDPRPSIEQLVVWIAYMVPVTLLFLRPRPRTEAATAGSAVRAS